MRNDGPPPWLLYRQRYHYDTSLDKVAYGMAVYVMLGVVCLFGTIFLGLLTALTLSQ